MKSFKNYFGMASVLVFTLFSFTAVQAEEGKKDCKADTDKYCANVSKEHGAIKKCLDEHKSELSQDCTTFIQEMQKKREEMKSSCESDVDKFCKTEKEAHKGVKECLVQHKSELSSACSEQMKKTADHPKKLECKSDVAKLCADVKPGGGAIINCLKQHESELSDTCKQGLSQAKTEGKE